MSISFRISDFVRQRLGDRDTSDYFAGDRELEDIIWRYVVCRCGTRQELTLCAVETQMTPLLTPGDSSVGTFWAYSCTQYTPSRYPAILAQCAFDQKINQPNHKYGLFQANAYVDGVFSDPQPDIDEIALLAEFPATVDSDSVVMTGHPVNLSRIMNDVFQAIADDIGKLAVYQSTLGGATDLREAAKIARAAGASWLRGSMISISPLKGSRRR